MADEDEEVDLTFVDAEESPEYEQATSPEELEQVTSPEELEQVTSPEEVERETSPEENPVPGQEDDEYESPTQEPKFSLGTQSSDEDPKPSTGYRSSELAASEWDKNLPEGCTLRVLDMMTDPDDDDFAKRLVREGRLEMTDVLEIIGPDGEIIGSKVLPHAKDAYMEEVALDEAERRGTRAFSWLSGGTAESQETGDLEFEMKEGTEEEPFSGGIMKYPRSLESLYNLIEPSREDEFNTQVEKLNDQIADTQHRICLEHKTRKIRKVKRFQLERRLVLNAVSEMGILYLPGNLIFPITGRRIDDSDIPFILEALKEIAENEFKGFNLAYNNITDEGLALLAPFIQERPSIIHVNLAHNDFTASGLHTLVTYLINRRSLQSLKISGVKVGDEGINSITCLYMCGKGPRDLDVSETDMSMPGFQALCTSFQAVDEDEDYPKFLTKYKLPFSLETLARLKLENHEFLKSQTYHRLCHSHFELVPPREKDRRLQEINEKNDEEKVNMVKSGKSGWRRDEFAPLIEETLPSVVIQSEEEKRVHVDLYDEAKESIPIHEKAKKHADVEEIIGEFKTIREKGCVPEKNGKPVIVCPSLYSLDIDEFLDDDESSSSEPLKVKAVFKHANPLYMDELVESAIAEHEAQQENKEREVADNLTAQKASVKFLREAFTDAGAFAGLSDYNNQADMAQVLFKTILQNAKRFLQAETEEGEGSDLTEPELRMIWEHSLQITQKIFRPVVPPHCKITEDVMDVFVEEFMKISCGTFYKLIQVPFFQEVFENAATKGCIESTLSKKTKTLEFNPEPLDIPYTECVRDIVLKFLEEVILRAAEIIGVGDPCHIRPNLAVPSPDEPVWPSIMDITEEHVEPLVDQLFRAGGLLAQDALTYKQEDQTNQDGGIEPAKQYLEGIFKQLTNFLYQIKDDDQKLAARLEKPIKRFTFSTKPVRLVLNRPIFTNYEAVMACKLATYLKNNDSIQCLHLRKWGFGEDGMAELMSKLVHNTNIVTLDLASNGIGAEGMRLMGEYLRKNQNLKHLLLNHNRLRNPGVQILTDAIPESSLLSINIAYNDITDVGLDAFLEAVGKSKIYSVYLLGNCFSQNTCDLINELFESGSLYRHECDVEVQEVDGEICLVKNAQARDTNEWYEVPAAVDVGLTCPPYFLEEYSPPKVSIFGAVDVEV